MPIYEYRCRGCHKKFEMIVLSAAAEGRRACPKCGQDGAERLVSRFATASREGSADFGDMGGDDFDEGGGGDHEGAFPGEDDGGFGEDDDGGLDD